MKGTEDLKKNITTYIPDELDNMSQTQQKFLKKYPDALSSADVFGRNQNEFNREVLDCIEELYDRCHRLEDALATEILARKKATAPLPSIKKELDGVRLRSTLNSNQVEKIDSALERYSEKTEDYILHIAPGARHKDCPKGCREAKIDTLINMPEKLDSIKKASGAEREQKLRDLEKLCMKAVSRELSYFNAYEEIGIDFYGNSKYAEILYRNIYRNSIYKIESGNTSNDSGKFFVYCGETAKIPEKILLKSGMIFITGEKPFEGLDEEFINDLRFLNDCGIHTYTALSAEALNALRSEGFRCVAAATAEELSYGRIIAAVEKGVENSVPGGALKFSTLTKKLEAADVKLMRAPEEIVGYMLKKRSDNNDCSYSCVKSLEKTTSAAIIKNYFGSANITSADLSQAPDEKTDFLTAFDYINHFEYKVRKNLYQKARLMLKQDGLLLFSGRDPVTGIKLRAIEGWESFPVYEAMWTPGQLIQELEENGFRVRFLIPTGSGLYDNMPAKYKDIPTFYIIGAVPLK